MTTSVAVVSVRPSGIRRYYAGEAEGAEPPVAPSASAAGGRDVAGPQIELPAEPVATGELVVPITYRKLTTVTKDAHGSIRSVRLSIPAGTSMPASVRAYVVADVYPLLVRVVG